MTQSFCCTCPDEQGRSRVSSAGNRTPHDTEKLFSIVILKFKNLNSEDRPAPIGTVCSGGGPRRLICRPVRRHNWWHSRGQLAPPRCVPRTGGPNRSSGPQQRLPRAESICALSFFLPRLRESLRR